MAVTNVRVTDSRNNTRRVYEVPEGSTVAAVLTAAGIPFSEAGYAITYRAQGTPTIVALTPDGINNTVVTDMSDVFATFTQQKGNKGN